jgi:NAD(P)-dependent dehydrogenase (short-subunit alcohol dehydrogenase family)
LFCLSLIRASSGLGKELAKRFYGEGYNLVLVSSNETKLFEARDDIFREQLISSGLPSLADVQGHPLNALPFPSSRISFPEIPSDLPDAKAFKYPANIRFRDIQLVSANLEEPSSPSMIVNQLEQKGIDSKVIFILIFSYFFLTLLLLLSFISS